MDVPDLAVLDECGRDEQAVVGGLLDERHDRREALGRVCELGEPRVVEAHRHLGREILELVPGQPELREDDELGAGGPRLARAARGDGARFTSSRPSCGAIWARAIRIGLTFGAYANVLGAAAGAAAASARRGTADARLPDAPGPSVTASPGVPTAATGARAGCVTTGDANIRVRSRDRSPSPCASPPAATPSNRARACCRPGAHRRPRRRSPSSAIRRHVVPGRRRRPVRPGGGAGRGPRGVHRATSSGSARPTRPPSSSSCADPTSPSWRRSPPRRSRSTTRPGSRRTSGPARLATSRSSPRSTGPARTDSKRWDRGSEISLARNDAYWGTPRPERAADRPLARPSGRARSSSSRTRPSTGSTTSTRRVVAAIEDDVSLQPAPREGLNVVYLGLNATFAPFDNELRPASHRHGHRPASAW